MKQLLCCLLVLLITGCKEKYNSPVHSPVTGYLVVDGVINSGPGTAGLTLSRTTKFSNTSIVYENGAAVSIQGQDSSIYMLTGKGNGFYSTDSIKLDNSMKYRLRITVAGGEQYVSDFAEVRSNPPIDSISWKLENDGLQLYINTHNPQDNTRYYQWFYDETWQVNSSFLSYLKFKNLPGNQVTVVYKDTVNFSYDPNIINCWQFNTPSNIFLGSTAKLSKDIVYLPLTFVPHGSIKIGVLYSVHLRQFAWTADGYEFLDKMRKNTETTGTVFDAQPSELKGNIHSLTDASEPVIGYFNICAAQEKRIFIYNSDVPGWGYDPGCKEVSVENNTDSIIKKALGLLPTTVMSPLPFHGIAIFGAATPDCVDCTLLGSNKKPSYWP